MPLLLENFPSPSTSADMPCSTAPQGHQLRTDFEKINVHDGEMVFNHFLSHRPLCQRHRSSLHKNIYPHPKYLSIFPGLLNISIWTLVHELWGTNTAHINAQGFWGHLPGLAESTEKWGLNEFFKPSQQGKGPGLPPSEYPNSTTSSLSAQRLQNNGPFSPSCSVLAPPHATT